MKCRHCHAETTLQMVDLGFAPPSNAYRTKQMLRTSEKYYPLRVLVCTGCWLAQTEDCAAVDELFGPDYAYFSSVSSGWLAHAAAYADKVIGQLNLTSDSLVIEIASNDGYLLKNFLASGVPCLGIEPTAGTAAVAEKLGIAVMREFFDEQLGRKLAASGRQADLIIGNNVYAHVPDINGFTRGLKAALKPAGTITLEFPHLMKLLEHTQFDCVYHEHFSYLSLYTVDRIFEAAGLRVWDVEELATHGGSLRIYGCHDADAREVAARVSAMLAEEARRGLQTAAAYACFQAGADRIKDDFLAFLIEQKRAGRKVAAYGAAAKGNTLLNYAGVKPDLLPYICDAAPSKQGKFMPGSHIPILAPDALFARRPDYVVILPWNLTAEIKHQNAELVRTGTKFVAVVPELTIQSQ